MMKLVKKHQRALLVVLIMICMGIVMIGGVRYVKGLRRDLQDQAIRNVMTVTAQQRQAFDNFISSDRERLHSFADFFSKNSHNDAGEIQQQLTLFSDVDAIYSVICMDEGWFCSNTSENIRQLTEEQLDRYRSFTGSGVRDTYLSVFSGDPKFGYYEAFTFNSGHKGLIQKSYDRTKVSETFSLSFYNDRGLAYVVNDSGEILLRSVGMIGDHLYANIFDVLTGTNGKQEDIDTFRQALSAQEEGSMNFTGDMGSFIYTYVPVKSVEGWYLVSIIPVDAIAEETDHILMNTQTTLWLLLLILATCAVFLLLMWQTHKDIEDKDRQVAYHAQLFDVFIAYLSRNTDDVYMMVDHDSDKVEYVSPNVEQVLGVDAEHVIDALYTADMAADPETGAAYYNEVRALAPGQAAARNTERVDPTTGEHKYFWENAYRADIQGHRKWVIYIADRTKERKIQHSLSEALRMAQAASEAKTAFLANVSHDIRTPMNAIIGFLALMKDEADDPEMVREYIQRIDAASQHLLGLINDVLDMNKIESGSTTLNVSEIDLADVINGVNTIIRPQVKAKDQTFDIFVSQLRYEHLLGDKLRIDQILINLLSNAVKYTRKGGTIQFRVEELPQVVDDYSRVRFTVSDNGLGMSEDYQKVIFEPFTREESNVTREIQGTGLGMAITKSLVDLMGGTIKVDSVLGKGSTFTVELELHIQEKEDDPRFWTGYKVSRVLIADDDEEFCRNVVRTMSRTEVVTDYVTDGRTALQRMREQREAGRPYDLILLDWKMPEPNGMETARLIRKDYPDKIPILLLTAYDWSDIETEAIENGVDHFMPKPFFISTFKEAIRQVMGSLKQEKTSQANVIQDKHILVVDDIEVNRIILVKILSTLGASCGTAGNGQEAVETFEASRPGDYDLILMDVQMPVMDGYSATKTIRASGHPSAKTIPIIAMTANAFVDDVREAIEAGMDAHIAKPVQIDTLKTTIQQVLDSRQGQTDTI